MLKFYKTWLTFIVVFGMLCWVCYEVNPTKECKDVMPYIWLGVSFFTALVLGIIQDANKNR